MKKIYPALVLAALYFSSCQKEVSIENDDPVPVVSTDSSYLDKIYYMANQGAGNDTVAIDSYQYDANKRVVSVTYREDDGTSTNTLEVYATEKHSYNGNDTLPYKMVRVEYNDLVPNDTTVTYFTYSAIGQRIKDSSLISKHTGVSTARLDKKIVLYQYVPGKIYGRTEDVTLADNSPIPVVTGVTSVSADTAVVDASGNIISSVRWDAGASSPSVISSFTYDNQPSPFARLSNFRAIAVFPSRETFINEMQAKNNRLHAVQSSGYDEDLTGKYTYHVNGYPKKIFETDIITGDTFTTLFIYKAL